MDVVFAVGGLVIIAIVLTVAIRLLRSPAYRYPGDRDPKRRSSLEWLTSWFGRSP
jgi:hypothetical protein